MYLQGDTIGYMTPLKATNFRIDEEMLGGLQEIRKRIGIPVSEQVRRAIKTNRRQLGASEN